jgi:LAO/AO transport system kinase
VSADLAEGVRRGDPRAVARALTWVENGTEEGAALLRALGGRARAAHRVGVTGPPGAGKSTLVSALAGLWRAAGRKVGILAVDPSSPFTGGALLGDRIRMGAHAGDPSVFIRSLATRGALGGLAPGVDDAADVLEVAGFDPVVVETVGVGQGEVEIAKAADTTVVVLAPGAGDEIQGMKAGLLEVADLIVVNQADREGAHRLLASLEAALGLSARKAPPILRTVATTGAGVDDLRERIDARADGARAEVAERRRARARGRVRAEVDRRRAKDFWSGRDQALDEAARAVAEGRATVAEAAERFREGMP